MSIGSELLRFSDRKIAFMDLETQRLNIQQDNLPFQCSIIIMQRGKVLGSHDHYIKWPGYKMGKDAAAITRFQQHWVDNGDDPEYVLEIWEQYARDPEYLLGGHNYIGFDCPVWQLWRRALGRKPDWSSLDRTLDTHLLARAFKMGWKPDRENLLAWFHKVSDAHQKGVKTGLSLMAKELDIPFEEGRLHDGLYDLGLNAQVLWKLANLMEI